MKYKLLVLDVDGTLLNSEKEISKRTLAALLKVQQMGVRIVLASGRPTYGLMPLAMKLELGNYGGFILSYNGGQIINAQNGELLFERRINPEMLPYLEKKARKNGFALFTYHDDTIITDSPENVHIQNEARLNNLQIIKEEEFSAAVDFAPCKWLLPLNKCINSCQVTYFFVGHLFFITLLTTRMEDTSLLVEVNTSTFHTWDERPLCTTVPTARTVSPSCAEDI